MKKTLFSLTLMLLVVLTASAQRSFQYKNITEDGETFGKADMAGLIITCNKSKPLTFESNLDSIKVYKTLEDGDNNIYQIILDASKFNIRQLSVKSAGYYTLIIHLNMKNGYIYRYEIFDPNDAIDGTCFQSHREKGLQYFDDCSYLAAKEQFELAKQCDEIGESQRLEAEQHINDCDSMIEWRRLGNEAASMLDYKTAMEYFSKAQALNSQDRYVVNRYAECSVAQSERSQKYFDAAQVYFKNKEYEDAIFMYKKVEALRENNVGQALSMRITAERLLKRRKSTNSYVGLEFGLGDNKLYGLSFGSYRNHTGGYFTIKANDAVLDFTRSDYNLDKIPEVDITFGWTMPIIKKMNDVFQGLYVHFGPGIALLSKYTPNKDEFTEEQISKGVTQQMVENLLANNPNKKASDYIDSNITAAIIIPEFGATLKLWRVAIRATWQYRLAIDKKYDSTFGKTQWSLGFGWCF